MHNSFNILYDILIDYGLSEQEINMLLARFLQEEASDYIEAMELCEIDREQLRENKKIIH